MRSARRALGMVTAALAVLPSLTMATAFAAGWPEVPSPPRAKVEWVSQDLRINGLPSRISHFESELGVDEVLQYFRGRWSKGSMQPREVSAAGWHSIATIQDQYQLVVQARPRTPQGSEGMLSVASLSELKSDYLPPDWPAWSSVRVMQVTESRDGPRRSHVVSMVSDDSFEDNVRRVRDTWLRRGFALDQQHDTPPTSGLRSWIGLFSKTDRTLDVIVAYDDAARRTYITANLLTVATGQATP